MPQREIDGRLYDVGSDWDSLTLEQKGQRVDELAKGGGGQIAAPPPDTAAGVGQALLTAGVRGLGAIADKGLDPLSSIRRLISPKLEEAEYAGSVHPGQMAGDAFFKYTGLPEYQTPDSPIGRTLMQGTTGAASGSPFGLPGMALGFLSGAAGQGAREYFKDTLSPDNTARAETVASLLPGGALAVRGATRAAPQAEIPTASELLKTGGEQFKQFRAQPTQVDPTPLGNMATGLRSQLENDGFDFQMAPRVTRVLDELSSPPNPGPGGQTYQSPQNLHIVRRRLEGIIKDNRGRDGNSDEFAAASATLRELDGFIANLGQNPADIVGGTLGDASRTAELFNTARANYLAGQKLNRLTGEENRAITGVGERAQIQADAANSGSNYDNAMRQQVKAFLQNDKNLGGFTPEELAALRGVAAGNLPTAVLRQIGNRLGGSGWTSTATAGVPAVGALAAGEPTLAAILGIGLPVVGQTAKGLENALARRSLGRVEDVVAKNSPLYQERLQQLQQQMTPRDWTVIKALIPGLLGAP